MTEPKYLYRIPPCPVFDIPGTESWLEDMAAKGWQLTHDGFFAGFATFEAAPPQRMRFRLEATATNGGLFSEEYSPDNDAAEMNAQMGWQYRARRGQFHIYCSADPDAPELHTDPRIQAMSMATLSEYLRKELFGTVFTVIFHFLLFYSDILVSSAIAFGTWLVALILGLLLWGLVRQLKNLHTLAKLRSQLQSGEPLPHRSDYHRYRHRHTIANVTRIALWFVVLVSVLVLAGRSITEEDAIKLEEYHSPFPFATLEVLYPEADVTPENGFLENKVTVWSDFLAPENYDYSEYASLRFPDGSRVDCYLSLDYHRCRWEWTADALCREFVSQTGDNPVEHLADRLFREEETFVTELKVDGADYAGYYYKYRGSPYLILRRDDVVIRVNVDFLGTGPKVEPMELAEAILFHIQ